MALDRQGHDRLADFFAGVSGHASGFQGTTFSYVALRDGDRWIVVTASLILHALAPTVTDRRFESPVAKAGVFALDSAKALEFLIELTNGPIETPHGALEFPAAAAGSPPRYAINHTPYNPVGNQARVDTAQIFGEQAERFIRQPGLDWSLRASTTPFDGLADLVSDFGVPAVGHTIAVNVVAHCGVMVDSSSNLVGTKAKLAVGLALGLDPNLAAAGVVVRNQREVQRLYFSGADLSWQHDAIRQIGEVMFEVPSGAILHCFASYGGITHHRYWVLDAIRTQNHRRTALEAADVSMQTIGEIFAEAKIDRGVARKFESAVSWLLWLLGFSPAHLGEVPRTQDAPDIVVATPLGHIAVVECTTGLVKNEKLLSLRERARAVRQRLEDSNMGWAHVLPVLVCARSNQEVEPERDGAAAMGITVVDGEDLHEFLRDRTPFPPDADRLFREIEDALAQRLSATSGN